MRFANISRGSPSWFQLSIFICKILWYSYPRHRKLIQPMQEMMRIICYFHLTSEKLLNLLKCLKIYLFQKHCELSTFSIRHKDHSGMVHEQLLWQIMTQIFINWLWGNRLIWIFEWDPPLLCSSQNPSSLITSSNTYLGGHWYYFQRLR